MFLKSKRYNVFFPPGDVRICLFFFPTCTNETLLGQAPPHSGIRPPRQIKCIDIFKSIGITDTAVLMENDGGAVGGNGFWLLFPLHHHYSPSSLNSRFSNAVRNHGGLIKHWCNMGCSGRSRITLWAERSWEKPDP